MGLVDLVEVELHAFSDASSNGYGCVCYLRVRIGEEYHVTFVTGKSRVVPSGKSLTIPRLELTAAVVAARTAKMVVREHDVKFNRIFFWTDSTTVLRYLQNETTRFKLFVANRIAIIRELSSVEQWRYVDTKCNPADAFSRGVSPAKPEEAQTWLSGPEFLRREEIDWPEVPFSCDPIEETGEVVGVSKCAACEVLVDELSLFDRFWKQFSTLGRLLRATAWLLRLRDLLRGKQFKGTELTAFELEAALTAVIRIAQRQALGNVIGELENCGIDAAIKFAKLDGEKTQLKSLRKLLPFLADGVLRVGGRLQHSSESYEFKHPVILPKRHPVTGLIVKLTHSRAGHEGVKHTLSMLREKYWIIGGASTVKHYLKECVVCRNRRAAPGTQIMAPLPRARVECGQRVFHSTGADLFGHFLVKRGRSDVKRWGCIFTCFSTRAVHLEVVESLSTVSFMQSFTRFLCSHGYSTKEMYTDNGTNFVGAEAILLKHSAEFDASQLSRELSAFGINWFFNPPAASHQGGVYERLIRSVRKIMSALCEERHVYRITSDEQLTTIFKMVEYIMNSRPLTTVSSSEPSDAKALSPMMIMNGAILPTAAPGEFLDRDGLRGAWKASQAFAEAFWVRFRKEYIVLLQKRQKWLFPKRNLQVGDVVLIYDDQAKRNAWPKGVITEVVPDKFGVVRRVVVRSGPGQFLRRDVRKLCLLEASQPNDKDSAT